MVKRDLMRHIYCVCIGEANYLWLVQRYKGTKTTDFFVTAVSQCYDEINNQFLKFTYSFNDWMNRREYENQ
jgi:hypothetical protein